MVQIFQSVVNFQALDDSGRALIAAGSPAICEGGNAKSEGGSLPGFCQNLSGTRQADRAECF